MRDLISGPAQPITIGFVCYFIWMLTSLTWSWYWEMNNRSDRALLHLLAAVFALLFLLD